MKQLARVSGHQSLGRLSYSILQLTYGSHANSRSVWVVVATLLQTNLMRDFIPTQTVLSVTQPLDECLHHKFLLISSRPYMSHVRRSLNSKIASLSFYENVKHLLDLIKLQTVLSMERQVIMILFDCYLSICERDPVLPYYQRQVR